MMIIFTYASIVSSTSTPCCTSWWALITYVHIVYCSVPYSGVYNEYLPYLTVHTHLQSADHHKSSPVSGFESKAMISWEHYHVRFDKYYHVLETNQCDQSSMTHIFYVFYSNFIEEPLLLIIITYLVVVHLKKP